MAVSSSHSLKRFHLVSYESELGTIHLHASEDTTLKAKVSVIIGPNGSGKSRILADIVDELVHLSELREDPTTQKGSYSARRRPSRAVLTYSLDNKLCSIERNEKSVKASVNGTTVDLSEIPFPNKAFAVAHLPVDRFLFSKNEPASFYSYLGLRQSSNLTTTGALETKVIFSLLKGLAKPQFSGHLNAWLNLLNLAGPPRISFTIVNSEFLKADHDAFTSLARKHVLKRRYGNQNLPQEVEIQLAPLLETSATFFAALPALGKIDSRARPTFSTNLHNQTTADVFSTLAAGLEAAKALRLITDLSLHFVKNGSDIRFTDLSSGEQQIMGTTTRLLSEIEAGSVVVIDEPEVSLHPQWQMQYIPTLLGTLVDNPATHVLIATHSHFLVSDVDPNRSTLIVAAKGTPPIFKEFEGVVYGRSPENILFRAFGISAAGNFYVQRDLAVALGMISGTQRTNLKELVEIRSRLSRIANEGDEPLTIVLAEIDLFLSGDSNEKT